MPRTKREGIFYGVVMAFTMSIFMNLLNTFYTLACQWNRSGERCCCSQ